MELHLLAGKNTHMFSALLYALVVLARVASQSLTAAIPGLVLDTNRNSRSVIAVEESAAGLQLIKLKTEELEIDSRTRFQPRDPQTAQDQSSGHIENDTPWNRWLRTGRSVGRKCLSSCSQRNHHRMLSTPGPRAPPRNGAGFILSLGGHAPVLGTPWPDLMQL